MGYEIIAMSVSVCLSVSRPMFVCLSARAVRISHEPYVATSQNLLRLLPVAMARTPMAALRYVMRFQFSG